MNKRFVIGFVCGLLLFIVINLIAAQLLSDCGLAPVFGTSPCADAITRIGWPLQFYESGGFMYQQTINFPYFLIDVMVALALAAGIGWLFSRTKKTPPK